MLLIIDSASRDMDEANSRKPRYPTSSLLFACAFEGALLVIAYAGGWLVEVDPLAALTSDWIAVIAGLAAVFPMLALLWWGTHYPNGMLGKVTQEARAFVGQLLGGIGIGGFALISILAGVSEEALFRGLIQETVSAHSTQWVGIVVASVLFGLAHAVSRAYALVATLIGIYLGLLYVYSGSIVAPIVCHAVYDFIALWWLARPRS